MTAPAQAPEDSAEYVLLSLRSALCRYRMLAADCEMIGIALKNNWVCPADAALWARDCGVIELVAVPEEAA